MSTVSKTMTAYEFYDWVHQPENRGGCFELERGEIVEMPPPGKYHGFVCGNIAGLLRDYAIREQRGYACTNDAGVIVETDPDTVRGPDVTFYDDDQTASDMDRQYAAEPPLLAVDVLSPTDRLNRTTLRVAQMLGRGVQTVWIVDPEARDVCIHRPGQEPRLLTETDSLADDALPGFECAVADFFSMPRK